MLVLHAIPDGFGSSSESADFSRFASDRFQEPIFISHLEADSKKHSLNMNASHALH